MKKNIILILLLFFANELHSKELEVSANIKIENDTLVLKLFFTNNSTAPVYVDIGHWLVQIDNDFDVKVEFNSIDKGCLYNSLWFFPLDSTSFGKHIYASTLDILGVGPIDQSIPKLLKIIPNANKEVMIHYYNDDYIEKIVSTNLLKFAYNCSYMVEEKLQRFKALIDSKDFSKIIIDSNITLNFNYDSLKNDNFFEPFNSKKDSPRILVINPLILNKEFENSHESQEILRDLFENKVYFLKNYDDKEISDK